ncbi:MULTISPECIES: TRAP transporter small permease subunit [Thalassobaculum]|uniref:TRAP transporter small permease protein n=1 Tax=Thalassobaculum litoreum DSM 18839 TaxID=1123362 RepID=A0A8G2EYZ6_9PROT|nr:MULTISPECIES: TRAP transporter small permease [Thalassobaculum]SDF85783.1 TRAP-type mannitol/chloroaromatic compound transport system, small permease component [Thalassobaculum litoreum DSM 18839]
MTELSTLTADQAVSGGRMLNRLDRMLGAVERATALFSGLFIFALMLVGVTQILGRKLFNAPIFGYIDAVEMSIAVFAFLAIAYCERMNGHVRMEILIGKLRGRPLWIAEALGQILGLFVLAVLIWYGWEHAMRAYEYGDSTIDAQIPWWPSKLLIPAAFALLFLRLLLNLVGYLRLAIDREAAPVAVPLIADVRRQAMEEATGAGAVDGQTAEKSSDGSVR